MASVEKTEGAVKRRRATGSEPKYLCDNCGHKRKTPCTCMRKSPQASTQDSEA
jgi:hypothetical protein